jgi:hypothetical protein
MAKHDDGRARRDLAGIGPHPGESEHLVPLRELEGFKVAAGEPDIRGWDVRTLSGRPIGTIVELLADRGMGQVVMLDIDLAGSDRHTFAPIRAAQIDRARRIVLIDSGDLTEQLPSLRRREALSDDDARQFGDDYRRAYGEEVVIERPATGDDVVVRRGVTLEPGTSRAEADLGPRAGREGEPPGETRL